MDDISEKEKLLVELVDFVRSKYFGKYPAKVVRNDDPDNIGRIKVKLEEIYGNNDSPWALPCVPFAGQNHGLITLPEIGDGVWIDFVRGNPSTPVWTGSWWAVGEMPPTTAKCRSLVTSAGHKIVVDEDNDELKLVHANGAEITLTNNSITLKIGSSSIVLSGQDVNINNGGLVVR